MRYLNNLQYFTISRKKVDETNLQIGLVPNLVLYCFEANKQFGGDFDATLVQHDITHALLLKSLGLTNIDMFSPWAEILVSCYQLEVLKDENLKKATIRVLKKLKDRNDSSVDYINLELAAESNKALIIMILIAYKTPLNILNKLRLLYDKALELFSEIDTSELDLQIQKLTNKGDIMLRYSDSKHFEIKTDRIVDVPDFLALTGGNTQLKEKLHWLQNFVRENTSK